MRTKLFFCIILLGNLCRSQSLYDLNTIQKIEIQFSQSNWDYMMDTAKGGADGYLMSTWVKINGVQYDSAGVKYKGNSSYNSTYSKNPLHIELNAFKEQAHQGFKDIKLGNNYADPSMIREVLAYDLLRNYMHCSKANFAKVYINGAYYGVYSNAENVSKKFYAEHFYSTGNSTFKCNPVLTPGPSTKSNLKFINTDSSSYFNFYELKSDAGWKDLVKLCDTVTNHASALERNIDMDRAIWMLAFNIAFDNLDSYSGAFCQNYYLYKDNHKRFNPVIWDLNMCFGGLPFVGSGTVSLGSLSISNLQTLPLNIHSTDVNWPLINQVMSNPMYKRMYGAHVKTIMNEMISTNYYQTRAAIFQSLIDTSVQSDPFKFYTYTDFQNGMSANVSVGSYSVPGITTLMSARNNYLQAQPEFTLVQPTLTNIAFTPALPSLFDTIWVTANISNQNYAYLGYRDIISSPFKKLQLFDDGLHHDGTAGDGVFGQKIIASSSSIQYYIYAENSNAGKFAPERAEHEFYSISVSNPLVAKNSVFLNEIMAINTSAAQDANGQYEDWVEIFNATSNNINLGNTYLSDNSSNLHKWKFPANTVLPANNVIAVWLDEDTTHLGLHANFKLAATGGSLFFVNSANTILDSLSFGTQSANNSLYRCPNGTGAWANTSSSSYQALNCGVGLHERPMETTSFKVFPNPANNCVHFLNWEPIDRLEVYSLDGKKIMEYGNTNSNSISIVTNDLTEGVYFARVNNKNSTRFIVKH